MKEKNEIDQLREEIAYLQNKQTVEMLRLRKQFHLTYESLRPVNLIKGVFHDVVSSPDIKQDVLKGISGLLIGYLSKNGLIGSSKNPIKNILGTMVQLAITKFVTKKTSSSDEEQPDDKEENHPQ